MIALVVGAVAIAAALEAYAQGREIYRVNERIARLQEQGRVALSVMEPDVEMAGFYGFTRSADVIRFVLGGASSVTAADADELRQFAVNPGAVVPPAVTVLPPGAHVCGVNFAVDVSMPVQGSNDIFALGRGPTGCDAYQRRAQTGADTLTLRRATTQPSAPEANRIQIYASRDSSQTSALMFVDGRAPGPLDDDHRVHNLVVRTYYVAADSVGQRGFPALRVKSLTRSGSALSFDEDEVMAGIEDLQVQFGIGTIGESNGQVARYVNPDFAELPWAPVVSVRVWLRVRADIPEPSFTDARTYRYAGVVYTPAGAESHYRRVLVAKTLTRRNARAT
jgi:type IV pilus assembly protein PilW